jgi:hypothetical protein
MATYVHGFGKNGADPLARHALGKLEAMLFGTTAAAD